jgi:hypothetical protein
MECDQLIPYQHAFTEKNETVYDPVKNELFDKKEYYSRYRVIIARSYDQKEMCQSITKKGGYGPWETFTSHIPIWMYGAFKLLPIHPGHPLTVLR